MVNRFYLKGIQSSANIEVAYLTIPMVQDQEMLIVSMDFRSHGVTKEELDFFPRGVVLQFCKISEMQSEVFDNVIDRLTKAKWDFAKCPDPFSIVVQGYPAMYKRKPKRDK